MHIILFTINILTVSLLAERQSIFKSPAVLENENDPNRNTIYGEFFVFFDKDCYTEAMIQEFVGLFKCYALNHNVRDLFPHIIDHWIEMDEIENCDEADVIVEWNDYCIIGVEENEEEEPSASNQCLSRPVESALWNLNTVSPAVTDGTPFIQFDSSYNPNVDIIVMDSGIDTSHSQFSGITIERIFDAYPGESLGSHGTHCTGTVLGKDYGSLRINSDTQIKLIDVRIFPSSGGTSSSTVLNGYDSIINYLTNNPGKKVIINMSFGGGNWAEKNTRLTRIRELGGIIFAAAGNSNDWASSYSPASSTDTITVGAMDQSNNRAWFSNYGRAVDIWAPGVNIKSAIVGGGSASWAGTSMATPLVAGIAANILANNPSLDFWGIKNRLLSHAVYDFDDGNGKTNLPRVQASCEEYGFTPTFTLRPSSNYENCLDVHGDEGDDVHVHHCHFGLNQKWKRGAPDADEYYAIISLYNNECLDVNRESNGIVDYSDNIITWPCSYGDNQKFKIDGGIIRVKENGGNWCVDFGDAGNNVHIWYCDYRNDTQRIDAVEETIIRSKYHSGQCLDASGGNVYLHPCRGDTNQEWRRGKTDSDGYYTLISEYNQRCLDVNREHNGIVDHSDNIITWPCHGADNQKFKIDGTLIKSKANGGNWCVDGGDYDHNVHIWDCSITSGNQQFEFPGFSSLTGSYSSAGSYSSMSAGSIGNMLESDDFEFMDKAESMISGKYLIEAIAALLMINIVCFIIYLRKRDNGSKKGYKVVKFDSSTDIEFPDQ